MEQKAKNVILDILETLIVSALVILAIYSTIGALELVYGDSMLPNFHTGERILVDKLATDFNRGDVVVLVPPNEPKKHYIKRLIGMPGDIIKIYNCHIYISRDNQKYKLAEPYIPSNVCTFGNVGLKEGRAVKIPEDHYVVLGDNRGNSIDSRVFGFVDKKELIGKAVFKFWPLPSLGFVK